MAETIRYSRKMTTVKGTAVQMIKGKLEQTDVTINVPSTMERAVKKAINDEVAKNKWSGFFETEDRVTVSEAWEIDFATFMKYAKPVQPDETETAKGGK